MPRATVLEMLKTAALCLAFTGMAATSSGFSLGLDYSVRLTGSDSTVIAAVDDAGSVYLLQTPVASSSAVIKLTPDGGQLAYLKMLGFVATAMDVDSAGSVYVAGPNLVAKLDGRGAGFLYQISITPDCVLTGLAVDNAGHAFVTGYTGATPLATTANAFQPTATAGNSHPFVVKVNAAGTGFDYATYVAGSNGDLAWAIAVNSSGEAFVTGEASSVDFPITPGAFDCTPPAFGGFVPFLARLTADGSSLVYSTFTGGGLSDRPLAVATTLQNSAVVYQQGAGTTTLLRFNPQGTALEFSRTLPASIVYLGSASGMLAVDAIGNTYATGSTTAANFPVKNSLSTCGTSSVYLTVLDPSGLLPSSARTKPRHGPGTTALPPAPQSNGCSPNTSSALRGSDCLSPPLPAPVWPIPSAAPAIPASPPSLRPTGSAARHSAARKAPSETARTRPYSQSHGSLAAAAPAPPLA
jgi:hypothetical protein